MCLGCSGLFMAQPRNTTMHGASRTLHRQRIKKMHAEPEPVVLSMGYVFAGDHELLAESTKCSAAPHDTSAPAPASPEALVLVSSQLPWLRYA